jgi:hypothetical protein
MAAGIQSQVNVAQAPALPGDFASANPRHSFVAGPGGLIAGPAGLTVGRFAWVSQSAFDPDGGPTVANNTGVGPVAGFVGRKIGDALITGYLVTFGNLIQPGQPATVFTDGDFWVKNDGLTAAEYGMVCYANYATGAANFAPAGAPLGATAAGFTIAAGTASVTASIAGNVLNVTAVGSGIVYPGSLISGTGVLAGSQITSQLSGAIGGIGTYALNYGEQTVASTAITTTYGLLTLSSTITGVFGLGDSISGTAVPAGSAIYANAGNGQGLTGAGGAGTYVTNLTGTASSGTLTAALNVATKWFAMSGGLPGEPVKISDQALG